MEKLITKDICMKVVQQCDPDNTNVLNNNIQIEKVLVKKFSDEQQGFMGEHFYLDIVTNEKKMYTFFIKSKPISLPSFESYVNELGIFKKEISIFQTLLETLGKFSVTRTWCPKSYYIFENDGIIMENLMQKGYKTLNHRAYFTYNQLKSFTKTLAAFHSTSIIYEELTRKNTNLKNFKLTDKYAHLLDESAYHNEETHVRRKWLISNTEAFLACAKDLEIFKPEYEQQIRNLLMDLPDRMKAATTYRQVMNHGDLWCNNIMFCGDESDADNLKCLFVDFQFCRYSSPAQDLMLAIYTTINRELRAKYYDHFLNMYYDALTIELKMYSLNINKLYPRNDFLKSCQEYQKIGILEGALFTMLVFFRPKDVDHMYLNADDFWKFNLGNKSEFILNIFRNDEHLRERVGEIYQDIVQYVI